VSGDLKRLLLQIASAVERWPGIRKDPVEVAMVTPTGAMICIASKIPPRDRAAVYAALPIIVTDDFAEAVRQIRAAAWAR
jgi:hypothetical protein